MIPIVLFVVVLILLFCISRKSSNRQSKQPETSTHSAEGSEEDLACRYKRKWMFTYAEKTAYWRLKRIADESGLILFSKVRLFDLIEPKDWARNYKSTQWRIQSKHVDFVLCDQTLVARYVVELDDYTHSLEDRKERDAFVNAALTECGYRILHINNSTDDSVIRTFLGRAPLQSAT